MRLGLVVSRAIRVSAWLIRVRGRGRPVSRFFNEEGELREREIQRRREEVTRGLWQPRVGGESGGDAEPVLW
jgi:hypothetical protein